MKMKNRKTISLFPVLAILVIFSMLSSCFSAYTGEEQAGTGSIVVKIGGQNNLRAAAFTDVVYTIELEDVNGVHSQPYVGISNPSVPGEHILVALLQVSIMPCK